MPHQARRARPGPGHALTLNDGHDYTRFGIQIPRSHIADWHTGYGECHGDAVKALQAAWQVTIIDPEWGRNTVLWSALAAFASAAR